MILQIEGKQIDLLKKNHNDSNHIMQNKGKKEIIAIKDTKGYIVPESRI